MDHEPEHEVAVDSQPVARSNARLWSGIILAACAGVLALSAFIEPDPRGFGTHAQLGTGPCGFLVITGYPCPTCGMTTAFARFVRGQWWGALLAQPAGLVLALGVGALGAVSGWTVIRGRWPTLRPRFITPYRFFLGLLVLLLGGWAFKVVVGLLTGVLPYR